VYFLGQISIGASSVASNQATGASFGIPAATKALYLMASASGAMFELGFGSATGATFATTAARGALLDAPLAVNGPFRYIPQGGNSPARTVVSVFNGSGSTITVNVYAAPM